MEKIALSQIVPDPTNERERIDWDHVDGLKERFLAQGFLPIGALTIRKVPASQWWADYEKSQRREDPRWRESVNVSLVPKSGELYQIVAGEHRYHGAIAAHLQSVPAHIFTGNAAEAKEVQIAENTGKSWTEKELLIMVKKAVDERKDFETIKKLTGKNANWIENRIAVSVLPMQVLQTIGSYASVSAMKALAKLYSLVGKVTHFKSREDVDLVVRDIAARWIEKDHPAGWLEQQAREMELDANQPWLIAGGTPVPNERDLEEKEFGTLITRYRSNVADLTGAIRDYLANWRGTNPDGDLQEFVHAAATRKHTRVAVLLDALKISEVMNRKLITMLCAQGDEEAACKVLAANAGAGNSCGMDDGGKLEPSPDLEPIGEDEEPEVVSRKLMAGVLKAWRSGNLVSTIKRAWIVGSGLPSDSWSLNNRILMIMQGTVDARGKRQWYTANRVIRKGARKIWIWGPVEESKRHSELKKDSPLFYPIATYAVEDTFGEAVTQPVDQVEKLPPLLDVAEKMGVKVDYAPPTKEAGGFYDPSSRRIVLHAKEWRVYFHELSHAVDHHLGMMPLIRKSDKSKRAKLNYARSEVVAETSAACLMALYGQGGEQVNFDYVKNWGEVAKYQSPESAVRSLLSRVLAVVNFILTCGSHPGETCPPNVARKLESKKRKAARAKAKKAAKQSGKKTTAKQSGKKKACKKCKAKNSRSLHSASARMPARKPKSSKRAPICPKSAKRLTLKIGSETLTNICVERVAVGHRWAGWTSDQSGDLYRINNFDQAEGHLTIQHSRSVSKIIDSKGREWRGTWKVVQGGNGRIGLVKEAK